MLFFYEATTQKGKLTKGEFSAESKEEVIAHLENRGMIPLVVVSQEEKSGLAEKPGGTFFDRIGPMDRIVLVRNLSSAIKAGLGIVEALDVLIEDATKTMMKRVLLDAKRNIQNGRPLHETFSAYDRDFPPVFAGLIRAGESSGNLDVALDELGRHLSKDYNMRKKIRAALSYPVVLLAASMLVIVFLLVFILPRITLSFAKSGIVLPPITRALLRISEFFTSHPYADIAVAAFLVWFFVYVRRTKTGKKVALAVAMRVPVLRTLVKKTALTQVTRTLGTLVASGIPITESLKLTGETVSNAYYKDAFLRSAETIKGGIALHNILDEHPRLFPKLLTSMIRVGERTGTLEHILKTSADLYEEEVDSALKELTTFIEPSLLLFMGVLIGLIALSILLPIYQLVGAFA